MGQRPFKELPSHKRISVLYRDTRRLRWLIEEEVGPITDAEWLRVVGTLPKQTGRILQAVRAFDNAKDQTSAAVHL